MPCSININSGSADILIDPRSFNDEAAIEVHRRSVRANILVLAGVEPEEDKMRLNPRWIKAFDGLNVDITVIDPTLIKRDELEAYLKLADGILLTGNDINIHPKHFGGGDPLNHRAYWGDYAARNSYDDRRFYVSKHMIEYARDHKVPILGVCLGMQEMNVVMGGTLQKKIEGHMTPYQDTDHFWDYPLHNIYMTRNGDLSAAFGYSVMAQSSIHNVGLIIEDLAPGLVIEALDGEWNVVEALSMPDHPCFIGVQFHAEEFRHVPDNRKVIEFFTRHALEHGYQRLPVLAAPSGLLQPVLHPETGEWDLKM